MRVARLSRVHPFIINYSRRRLEVPTSVSWINVLARSTSKGSNRPVVSSRIEWPLYILMFETNRTITSRIHHHWIYPLRPCSFSNSYLLILTLLIVDFGWASVSCYRILPLRLHDHRSTVCSRLPRFVIHFFGKIWISGALAVSTPPARMNNVKKCLTCELSKCLTRNSFSESYFRWSTVEVSFVQLPVFRCFCKYTESVSHDIFYCCLFVGFKLRTSLLISSFITSSGISHTIDSRCIFVDYTALVIIGYLLSTRSIRLLLRVFDHYRHYLLWSRQVRSKLDLGSSCCSSCQARPWSKFLLRNYCKCSLLFFAKSSFVP